MERDGQWYYFYADNLGSIVKITDASKNVVQIYEYDSYGMLKPSTSFRNSYTYTGREWDPETGLYYYRGRYYDPLDGIFISKDPLGFAGGDTNLYRYVGGNPVSFVDPFGLSPYSEILKQAQTSTATSLDAGVFQQSLENVIPIGTVGKVLRFGKTVVSAEKFHRVIKPQILEKAGDFCKKVGRNPDVKIVSEQIWLTGTGPFKGKTFKTLLDAIDFFK